MSSSVRGEAEATSYPGHFASTWGRSAKMALASAGHMTSKSPGWVFNYDNLCV